MFTINGGIMTSIRFIIFAILLCLNVTAIPISAKENKENKKLEIIFTHDLHSHLESFPFELDGIQQQVGGFARISTIIQQKKQESEAVLAVDAGDFSREHFIRPFMKRMRQN